MVTVVTISEGLQKIFKLRQAIRRQRRANNHTYLRLTEIHCEIQVLERDEADQDNDTLRHKEILTRAVNDFLWYLQKYHDMNRFVRLFKLNDMKDERLVITEEINHLYKMIGLAPCATVISGTASAEKNAERFLAKLEHVHSDGKLTHEQVQAALFKLVEKRAETRKSLMGKKPESATKEGCPIQAPVLNPHTANNVDEMGVGSSQKPKSTATSPVNDDVMYAENQELRHSTDEVDHSLTNQKPVLDEDTDIEEKEPAANVPFEVPSTMEAMLEEEVPEEGAPVTEKATTVVYKDGLADQKTIHSVVDDSTEEDTDDADLEHDFVSDCSTVPELLETLDNPEIDAQNKEAALLCLIRMCISSRIREQVFQRGGIPILSRLIRGCDSFLLQLYALHCLSWFAFLYSKLGESEFQELRGLVREAARHEIQPLLDMLQHGTDQEKELAAIRCSCLATRGDVDTLRCVGVLPPLVYLLQNGTDNQKLWATEALRSLATNNTHNCLELVSEGAIQSLVLLLQSGTDMQKQEAAHALGILAADNDDNRVKIAREGAIPPIVELMKAVTDAPNHWAVFALGSLALNDADRVKITAEGAIKPLVTLLRTGNDAQKRWATYAVGNLACTNDENTATSELKLAIFPLIELVSAGTDLQRQGAAYAVGSLGARNDEIRADIGREGAILPLIALVRWGTDAQKECAAYALGCIADNNENRMAMLDVGAIEPLESLVQTGTVKQKTQAQRALDCICSKNDGFSSDQFLTPVMGFFRGEGHTTVVEAALSTLKNVREGVTPLLLKLAKPATDDEIIGQDAAPTGSNEEISIAEAW